MWSGPCWPSRHHSGWSGPSVYSEPNSCPQGATANPQKGLFPPLHGSPVFFTSVSFTALMWAPSGQGEISYPKWKGQENFRFSSVFMNMHKIGYPWNWAQVQTFPHTHTLFEMISCQKQSCMAWVRFPTCHIGTQKSWDLGCLGIRDAPLVFLRLPVLHLYYLGSKRTYPELPPLPRSGAYKKPSP